jgi:hypothetical protein
VESGDKLRSTNIILILPRIILWTIAFPFDQVLELSAEHAAVENFLYFIVFFPINKLWRWWWCSSPSWDRIIRGRCQLDHIEDWMEALKRDWKAKSIGVKSNSPFNQVRT